MENNNKDREKNTRRIIIIIILLLLLALAFGFAAFSKSVNIINDKDRGNYVVYRGGVLSINPNRPENGIVKPTAIGGVEAEEATLTENGIININVHFTKTGQSATYSFFGVNNTKNPAYLNSVIFADKYCTPLGETTQEEADKACDGIVMNISVKNDTFDHTIGLIDDHVLKGESNEPIAVTIKYLKDSYITTSGFAVDFGISTITYSDVD